jgi:hypothetical protein
LGYFSTARPLFSVVRPWGTFYRSEASRPRCAPKPIYSPHPTMRKSTDIGPAASTHPISPIKRSGASRFAVQTRAVDP